MTKDKKSTGKAERKSPSKRKSDDVKLSVVRSFRLTQEVSDDLDRKIALSGYTGSEFIRQANIENKTVIAPLVKSRPRKKDLATVLQREILFLLQRQGANINQLAHALNVAKKTGVISDKLYVANLEELQKIESQANVFMSRVFQ